MVLSTAFAVWITSVLPARAHEVFPSIADMEQVDQDLIFDITIGIESFIAGIDLAAVSDTNEAPEATVYDELRALGPADLEERFMAFWPEMQDKVQVVVDGAMVPLLDPQLEIPEVGNVETVRQTVLTFRAPLPEGAETVQVGWDAAFGAMVLRQQGVDAPYDGYLQDGALSDPIPLGTPTSKGWLRSLFD